MLNIPRPPYSMLGYNRTIARTNINVLINIEPGVGGGRKRRGKKGNLPNTFDDDCSSFKKTEDNILLTYASCSSFSSFVLFSFLLHISIVFPPLHNIHHHHISITFPPTPPQPPPSHSHCFPPLPPPLHSYCFSSSTSTPPPPQHFYCFPSSTTTTLTTCLLLLFGQKGRTLTTYLVGK